MLMQCACSVLRYAAYADPTMHAVHSASHVHCKSHSFPTCRQKKKKKKDPRMKVSSLLCKLWHLQECIQFQVCIHSVCADSTMHATQCLIML